MRLDSLLTSILPTPLTVSALLLCLASALVLGILTALVFTRGCRHTASFALTLALLPMSVALVIMMVNGSIGTGLAVAGTFALVRFRSVPGTAREIAAIFTAVAMGLAMGMGMLGVAVVFFLLAAAAVLVRRNCTSAQCRKTRRHCALPCRKMWTTKPHCPTFSARTM